MGKRSRCCQRSGQIQGDCQCEYIPVCTRIYLGASVQPLEHRCAHTHVLMGECPSPGLLLHRQHAWSRAVLCTLGTTGTCPWACVRLGFPLRSHSPAWNGPITAAETRTEGWTHPATQPAAPAGMAAPGVLLSPGSRLHANLHRHQCQAWL